MKKYMVMICGEEEQFCCFYDSLEKAEQTRMDASVSMGYIAQIYEWSETDPITGEIVGGQYFFLYE